MVVVERRWPAAGATPVGKLAKCNSPGSSWHVLAIPEVPSCSSDGLLQLLGGPVVGGGLGLE